MLNFQVLAFYITLQPLATKCDNSFADNAANNKSNKY